MSIAMRAGYEVPKKKHHLCQYYDEVSQSFPPGLCSPGGAFTCDCKVCRKERAIAGARDDIGFDVNMSACTLKSDLLDMARPSAFVRSLPRVGICVHAGQNIVRAGSPTAG